MIQPIINLLTLANSGTYPGKREWFYPLKDKLLRRYGRADGWDKQVLLKTCWQCDGSGKDLFSKLDCTKCNGSGTYRIYIHWLERYRLGKEIFHIPVPADKLPLLIPDPVMLYTDLIRHEPVDDEAAWRAVVILMALFDLSMLVDLITWDWRQDMKLWWWRRSRGVKQMLNRWTRRWKGEGDIPF